MLGSRQIEADAVDEAIVNLRAALRESPRDPAILTLMAAAHERAGKTDLQREMLALAVEVSRSAPEESLRYARMLMSEQRYRPAEDVLVDAHFEGIARWPSRFYRHLLQAFLDPGVCQCLAMIPGVSRSGDRV